MFWMWISEATFLSSHLIPDRSALIWWMMHFVTDLSTHPSKHGTPNSQLISRIQIRWQSNESSKLTFKEVFCEPICSPDRIHLLIVSWYEIVPQPIVTFIHILLFYISWYDSASKIPNCVMKLKGKIGCCLQWNLTTETDASFDSEKFHFEISLKKGEIVYNRRQLYRRTIPSRIRLKMVCAHYWLNMQL